MILSKTIRGFDLIKFKDRYDVKCSLQKSSLATEDAIWFGCDDAEPKVLVPGEGWTSLDMPEDYMANTRMHLTQDDIKNLLPHLIHFAETGEINLNYKPEENHDIVE